MSKGPKIVWEDDDEDFGDIEPKTSRSSEFGRIMNPDQADQADAADDFAKLLAQTDRSVTPGEGDDWLDPGEKVKGVVYKVGAGDDVLVDLGTKRVGIISKIELAACTGGTEFKVGDKVEAIVLEIRGSEVFLGSKLSASLQAKNDLEAAKEARLPVKGRVTGVNKGGFEVALSGKSAFCPVSQIDTRFVEDKTSYVGKDFDFLVEKISGRDIVLSRAALLRVQQEELLDSVEKTLTSAPDKVYDGTVTSVRDFGAFVDIGGGLEGMVHISELGHGRYAKVSDVVTLGDRVRVKVLRLERGQDRPKISLSMKAASQDPWDDLGERYPEGSSQSGRVTRLADFGAFIELEPGIEGLIHISEMSWLKRIRHPSDVLEVAQTVQVRILSVDMEQRRISLSLKSPDEDPWLDATGRFASGKTLYAKVETLRSFGAILELSPGVTGLLPISTIRRAFGDSYRKAVAPGLEIEVSIAGLDERERKILLALPNLDEDQDDRQAYQDYLAAERERADKAAAETSKGSGGSGMGSFGELLAASLKKGR